MKHSKEIKPKRIPKKLIAESSKRIKAEMDKQKVKTYKVKKVKLNEVFVVEGYGYMFVRPNTVTVKSLQNDLVLIQIVNL